MICFYVSKLPDSSIEKFFSPIRSKVDVLIRLVETVKFLSLNLTGIKSDEAALYVYTGSANRFIYESTHKIFSIRSPFKVYNEDGQIKFKTQDGVLLDLEVLSQIQMVLEDENFLTYGIAELDDLCTRAFTRKVEEYWPIMMDLLAYEDGYLRFDHDPANASEFHPVDHIDVCYSNPSTYKIGVHERPSVQFMVSLFNKNLNPKFFQK